MNTGIGDAYNLAWKLARVAKSQAREDLLESYEAERMPFAQAILSGSDRGFRLLIAYRGQAKHLDALQSYLDRLFIRQEDQEQA